jgi:opacity protein-like surface antigen
VKFGACTSCGNFFRAGFAVAKLTSAMKKKFLPLFVCAIVASPAIAQNWSIGAGAGPFIFGDFVRRTLMTGNEGGSGEQTTTLSAKTKIGFAADLERNLGDRFAIRVEGTFAHAPLAVKGTRGSGVALSSGTLNETTFTLPLVLRLNPRGTFRFHIMGGPAYASYDITRNNATSTAPPFTGHRSRWGAAAGAGVAWQWSQNFAIEGQITDVTTSSPFSRSDFPSAFGTTKIPRTRNIHTTAGIRYRF